MAENSKIEWTHHTFNPWIGCQKVGPGCDHCYAEAMMADRYGRVEWGPHGSRSRTSAGNWRKPLAWDKAAAAAGERHRVFCASLADVFDNHASVDPVWRGALWRLIAETPHLDWMLLTKRPGNIAKMLPPDWGSGYPNVWLGCTVVNQEEADRDVPKLLAVPAAVRFLSMEPLLGPVELLGRGRKGGGYWMTMRPCTTCAVADEVGEPREEYSHSINCGWRKDTLRDCRGGIDLVIVGGESGPGARPMHPDWARSLRDQCHAAGVAFHFKQWGEWAPCIGRPVTHRWRRDGSFEVYDGGATYPGEQGAARVGKKAAGRLLDGRTWDQMPEVRHG